MPFTPSPRSLVRRATVALVLAAACHHAPRTTPPSAARPPRSLPTIGETPNFGTPNFGALLAGMSGDPAPRPYYTVIGLQARTQAGLVKTHEARGRLLFEIPPREIGRDMLIVTSIRGTPTGFGLTGTLGGPNRLVRWERRDGRVLLRAVSYRNVSSDTTAAARRAVDLIRYEPILATFAIEAFSPDSSPVIDVTRLFTGGVPELAGGGQRVLVDNSRSFVERVATFDKNVEIEASQTFVAVPTPLGTAGGVPNGAVSTTTELYHFSMVRLPDVPMRPRLADERVGFITTQQLDFGAAEPRVARRTFIDRWRLECADEAGERCVPKRAITYYVDPATPAWLVPYVKRGVLEWQPAFDSAGFRDALAVREVPADSVNDPRYAGESATVSMVRWLPSTTENAVGPSTVDPRSGEILDADVQLYQNVTNLARGWYVSQVGHLDPRAQRLPLPDSLVGRLVQSIVAHEIGHTLGMPHNMKASSMYPLDSLRSRTWVARMGFVPSVMDYARFDYVAQPEDHIALEDLVARVGPYDRFAVRWGYSPVPNTNTPEQERSTLNAWARQQDTVPWFRFGGDLGIYGADPGETNEAVGDADAVRATTFGIKNLRRVAALITPAATATPGATYDDLAELYARVVDQWATELGHVARIPGGQTKQQKVVGQPGEVYTPVSAARQRAAIAFLDANAFTTPTWLLDPALLRRIEPSGSIERIGAAQRQVLATLLDSPRLERMVEAEGLDRRADVYTLGAMLGDLRRGIWREAYRGAPVDPYRRRLQRTYVELLGAKINQPALSAAAVATIPRELVGTLQNAPDAVSLLRGELVDLDRDLAAALPKATDRTTRLHLKSVRDGIARILKPER